MIGLVPADKLRPSDLIGVNKDSYLVLDTLPAGKLGFMRAEIPSGGMRKLMGLMVLGHDRIRLESQGDGGGRETH